MINEKSNFNIKKYNNVFFSAEHLVLFENEDVILNLPGFVEEFKRNISNEIFTAYHKTVVYDIVAKVKFRSQERLGFKVNGLPLLFLSVSMTEKKTGREIKKFTVILDDSGSVVPFLEWEEA